ncbi:hypothetical protein LCGC14_0842620 [marine sediment metagenome]|uniref:HNH nuclease domain-containing protein n=1 Tax=marine sediment metagenome TaxID=412755 RepID=A0A0F9PHF5_9ZZZZ
MQESVLGQGEKEMTTEAPWGELRSNIYLRDKGMCWICNCFVRLEDYDLGHLVDRCNGGHDAYDNLAVMHKSCNLSKPYHETLEECLKWKLTAFIPTRLIEFPKEQRIKRQCYPAPSLESLTKKQQVAYNEQVAKIKPSTIVWIQGRPQGGTMWRILPPPYRQEDAFTMRQTPPGATYFEYGDIRDTLQIIGGELTSDIDINMGFIKYHISSNNGTLNITFSPRYNSNSGKRSTTIGMGKGQIPINDWRNAKEQGISLDEFKETYHKNHPVALII